MHKVWGSALLLRGRYDAMEPKEQASALFHLSIDVFILLFLVMMIYLGLTEMVSAFYFWVPLLGFLTWVRFKQARVRWSL